MSLVSCQTDTKEKFTLLLWSFIWNIFVAWSKRTLKWEKIFQDQKDSKHLQKD